MTIEPPPLPERHWSALCTKCGHSARLPAPPTVKHPQCTNCDYLAFTMQSDSYAEDQMLAYGHARALHALQSMKFHPSASHVSPDYRDWFNATVDQAIANYPRIAL